MKFSLQNFMRNRRRPSRGDIGMSLIVGTMGGVLGLCGLAVASHGIFRTLHVPFVGLGTLGIFIAVSLYTLNEIVTLNETQVRQRDRLRLARTMPAQYITSSYIANESNAEIRAALISRIGTAKYIQMIGARPYHTDDFGVLYRHGNFAVVKVINSTMESDGTFKEYWLRVPGANSNQPDSYCRICGRNIGGRGRIDTAKEAVAWTFELCSEHYSPEFAT